MPWDANFVHRRLELGAMSNHSSLADPYVVGSPFSNHSGSLPTCAASLKPSVHGTKSPTDTTGNDELCKPLHLADLAHTAFADKFARGGQWSSSRLA